MGAGCIVRCNKVSKPAKGKYLLLCVNSIIYFLLTSYTLVTYNFADFKCDFSSRNFPLWTVCLVYLLGWVRGPQLRWCWQAYAHCVDDHSPAVGRYCWSCQFSWLKFSHHQHSIVCPETSYTNVWLHNPCWLASIFSTVKSVGKTHYLQTCKYDVTGSKEYVTFMSV